MSELPKSPLTGEEQQCLFGISQLADLDAQANAMRVQLATVIDRAQQDHNFNEALIEYAFALQAAGKEQLALLVAALWAGRQWSVELSDRMRSESGAPALTPQEKARQRACQRAWDLVHGIKPEHTWLSFQAIAAVVAAVAFIALLLALNHIGGYISQ